MQPPTDKDIETYVGKWELSSFLAMLMTTSTRSVRVEQWTLGKTAQDGKWADQIKNQGQRIEDLERVLEAKPEQGNLLKPGTYLVK